jgi:ATP-binding cassette subfamily B protein
MTQSGLALVGPRLTEHALDVAVPKHDMGLLGLLAGLYLATLILDFAVEYGGTLLTTYIGQRVMYDLRMQIFGHLQRLSIAYFDRHPVGRLITRVTSDVETLNELFSSGVVTIFGDAFTLVAIMGMMLAIDFRLALVTFAVIPLVWLTARVFRRRVREAFGDIRVRLARLNAFLQERLSGMRIVQLFGREDDSARRFAALNREHLEAHLRSITVYAVFFPAVEVLTAVAMALLLWYGGLRVLDGTLTLGVLAAFIQYTRRFFQPLQDLSEKFNLLQAAMASSERVFALLGEPVTVRDGARPRCRGPCAARCGSRACGSGTAPRGRGCCATSRSPPRPGRRSRWWGTPERGRPPSSTCCSASTTRSAGGSRWTGWTSGSSRPRTCGRSSGSCSRISFCSRATSCTT